MEWIIELFHNFKEYLNPKIIIETLLAKGGTFVYVGLVFIVLTGINVSSFLSSALFRVVRVPDRSVRSLYYMRYAGRFD